MMAVERYLLDELTPEEKDAFEKHLFDCGDCALDLRAGSAFVTEARAQLFQLDTEPPTPAAHAIPASNKSKWSFLWRPSFAVPAFAALLAVIAWQNVSTIPSLRQAATEPRILPSNSFHAGTRGSSHTAALADRNGGLALTIALPQSAAYASYSFQLQDPGGKLVWTRNLPASNNAASEDNAVSLMIPGAGLVQGSYSLTIFGITPASGRVEIDRRVLDVQFDN
jgi:anti-sigma factor RsiW